MEQKMDLVKNHFLESHLVKLTELGRRQCEYKRLVNGTLKNPDTLFKRRHQIRAKQLMQERHDVASNIWIASSGRNATLNTRNLQYIKCHVECQEVLAAQVKKLKVDIANVEGDITRMNRNIYALNRKTVPEAQFNEHFVRVRKKYQNLENQLEVSKNRECALKADNAKLRNGLIKILKDRTIFNTSYTKLVQRLTRDKKYLVDLIEYALGTFENCINVYERMEQLRKKDERDREKYKEEMTQIMRELESEDNCVHFLTVKSRKRTLAELSPKELVRREQVRKKYNKKINLYNSVMRKIMSYTKTHKLKEVIERFRYHENLYYSYFNYSNELSYHITLLEHAVSRLYGNIRDLQQENYKTLHDQVIKLERLEETYKRKKMHNKELSKKRIASDKHLDHIVQNIEDIFEICKADASSMLDMLGDHNHVHITNLPRVLKIIEKRIFNVTAAVYVAERLEELNTGEEYTVQQIHKLYEWPTALNDIVLTQQCPECAEGDAFHIDEGADGTTNVATQQQTKRKLYEKVTQPEMQYRLHSISECRLPRSRILAAKKNT